MGAPTVTLLRLCLVVGVSLGLLGLVGGCSDPDQPSTLPSDTPTPTSSSASPTPSTPEDQIEQTVRAYFDEANRAFRSGETLALRSYTHRNCPCRGLADDIRRTVRDGGRYEAASYQLEFIKVHDVFGDTASAEVKAKVPAYQIIDSTGKVTEDSDGGALHTDLALVRMESGKWLIANSFDLE